MKISLGAARAIAHLHTGAGGKFIHGNIKSNNIILSRELSACASDFGLAQLMATPHFHPRLVGYRAPEVRQAKKPTQKSDVYSFGGGRLEVATGRRPMAPPPPGDTRIFRLVEWAWGMYGRDAVLDAADEALCGEFDAREVELVLVIGLWCAHPDARARPSIREAVEVLRSGMAARVPALPPRMPVAMYVQPYDPADKHVADDASKANHGMSSHDYGRQPPAADDYQTLSTTSSIPPVGSKQSVRLLSGR